MLVGDADGRLRVYSKDGGLERTLRAPAPVTAASFSPDGALVLGAGAERQSCGARKPERPPHAAPARHRVLRGVQPRRPLPAHHHRARRDALAHGYRPSRCHAREAGCDEGRLLARRPLVATLDARKPTLGSSRLRLEEPAGCCTCWRRIGKRSSSRASGSRRTPLPGDAELHGHVPLGCPQRPAVRPSPRRQARRGEAAAFSPDGNLLAVAEQDGGVRIWDVANGDRRYYFPAHTASVLAIAWSPDGALPADVTGPDPACAVGERALGGRLVGNLAGHGSAVRALAWRRDGRSLLSGGADRTARLWDTQFDQELSPIGRHRGAAVGASFDSAGHRIVSAGRGTAPPGSGVFAAGGCCTPSRTGARSKTPCSARTAAWS